MRTTKSKTITESVLLKHSCNLCLDYKFLALFKFILLITYSSTERLRDEFSAKSWSKIPLKRMSYKTNNTGIFYSRYTAITPFLCTRITQNWARIPQAILHSSHTCTAQFYMNCFSVAFSQPAMFSFYISCWGRGRCACVLKCQAAWNTHISEPHTKH